MKDSFVFPFVIAVFFGVLTEEVLAYENRHPHWLEKAHPAHLIHIP